MDVYGEALFATIAAHDHEGRLTTTAVSASESDVRRANIGIKKVSDTLPRHLDAYDLGFLDHQTFGLNRSTNPFGPRLLPVS